MWFYRVIGIVVLMFSSIISGLLLFLAKISDAAFAEQYLSAFPTGVVVSLLSSILLALTDIHDAVEATKK
jgi:hypothetical protein